MSAIWIGVGVAVVGAGISAYGAISQKNAANKAGQVDTATAAFNKKYDDALADQLDLDTIANIRTARAENKVYLSRQESSYAAAGVLAGTGSPLAAQITNAGRLEKQVQQEYTNSQQQQAAYRSKGAIGILAGDAQASADRAAGTLALVNGGASIAGKVFDAYRSGVFSGSGKTSAASGGEDF